MQNRYSPYISIGLLLVLGAILRLYAPFSLPFMHDELSALSRLEFNSLGELLENGVKVDGHPAGVQVFLYYWTKLFGKGEFAVKIPFVLMGVAAIWLTFRISFRFFGSKTGALLAATCISCLQFPLMYAQICRPYGSGLFLSLWMVWAWAEILQIFPEKPFSHKDTEEQLVLSPVEIRKKVMTIFLFAIATALCAYNHHFSLLFAAIVAGSGLFFLQKNTWKPYLIACCLAMLLYLPHLPITLFQLSVKGLDWLSPPTPAFFVNYLMYIFHYSYWVFGSVLVVTGMAFFSYGKYRKQANFVANQRMFSLRITLLLWFISLPLIGYLYSVYRAPVVQFSMLIFCLPYFFIFLFSFYKDDFLFSRSGLPQQAPTKPITKNIIWVPFALILTLSLIYERQHYRIFYHQPLESLRVQLDAFRQNISPSPSAIFSANPTYIAWYDKKYHRPKDYKLLAESDLENPERLRNYLDTLSTDYVLSGNLPHELNLIIQEKYPYMYPFFEGFTCEMWAFSKNLQDSSKQTVFFTSKYDFQATQNWQSKQENITQDTHGAIIYKIAKNQKSPIFEIPLHEISNSRHFWIEMSAELSEKAKGKWIFELRVGNKILDARSWEIAPYTTRMGKQKAYFAARMSDIFQSKISKDVQLKCYIENTSPEDADLYHLSIKARKSNPIIYGLVEKVGD